MRKTIEEIRTLLKSKKREFTQYARIESRVPNIEVVISNSNDNIAAYSSFRDGKYYIHVNTNLAFSEEINSNASDACVEEIYMRVKGLIAHECFHVRLTDFAVMGNIASSMCAGQQNVKELAQQWKDSSDEDVKEELLKKIKENIHIYIWNSYLRKMDNSFEDAWIEHNGVIDRPKTYPNIVAIRDSITDSEEDMLSHERFDSNSSAYIDAIITCIRHMSVIEYRRPCALEPLVNDSDLAPQEEYIRNLAYYARFACKNSEEVYATSKVAMKYIDHLIDAKVEEYFSEYVNNLMNDGESEFDSSNEIAGFDLPSELSISKQMASKSHGSSVQPNSEFNLDLPDEQQQEIDNSSDSSEDASKNSNGSDGSSSGNDSEKSGSDGSSSGNSSNSSQDGSEGDSEGDSEENPNGSSDAGSDNESESSENSGSGEAKDALSNDRKGKGKASHQSAKDIKDKQSLNGMKADAAVKEEAKSLEKSMEKAEQTKLKNDLSLDGNGKAPKLSESLANPSGLSHLHDNVELSLYTPDDMLKRAKEHASYFSSNDIAEIKKEGARFSNKLKEILMYQAQNKKLVGQRKGKLRPQSLYRANTDAKCFQTKTKGKNTKARLCVLVDQSGSMGGQKAHDAAHAAMLLFNACARIRVPISIFGHDTIFGRDSGTNLYHYIPFENPMRYEESLQGVAYAGGGNRDGLAYFHSCTDLARHKLPNEQCIMIVISDGAPADSGYCGEEANRDIQRFISFFEKQCGIKTIGIGIGDDVLDVPVIYENHVLVPDVEELPQELLKLLKDILVG